jgi:hypothetical protein
VPGNELESNGAKRSAYGIEEFRGSNVQTFSQLDDVDEAHVPFPTRLSRSLYYVEVYCHTNNFKFRKIFSHSYSRTSTGGASPCLPLPLTESETVVRASAAEPRAENCMKLCCGFCFVQRRSHVEKQQIRLLYIYMDLGDRCQLEHYESAVLSAGPGASQEDAEMGLHTRLHTR